jgi:hypothetical protein
MNTKNFSTGAAVLVGLLLVGTSGVAKAQGSCDEIDWNKEMVAEFPLIAESCTGIVERDGVQYAKFQAAMDRRFNDGRVKLRIFEPGGGYHITTVDPPEGFTAELGGRSVPFEQIPTGQRINIYVPGDRWELASAQAGSPEVVTAPIVAEPEAEEAAPVATTASLPETASPLPLVALLGGLLAVLGAGLALIRRR